MRSALILLLVLALVIPAGVNGLSDTGNPTDMSMAGATDPATTQPNVTSVRERTNVSVAGSTSDFTASASSNAMPGMVMGANQPVGLAMGMYSGALPDGVRARRMVYDNSTGQAGMGGMTYDSSTNTYSMAGMQGSSSMPMGGITYGSSTGSYAIPGNPGMTGMTYNGSTNGYSMPGMQNAAMMGSTGTGMAGMGSMSSGMAGMGMMGMMGGSGMAAMPMSGYGTTGNWTGYGNNVSGYGMSGDMDMMSGCGGSGESGTDTSCCDRPAGLDALFGGMGPGIMGSPAGFGMSGFAATAFILVLILLIIWSIVGILLIIYLAKIIQKQ